MHLGTISLTDLILRILQILRGPGPFSELKSGTAKPVLNGHAIGPRHSGLYREVVFEYRSEYIAQIPLGHHGVAS